MLAQGRAQRRPGYKRTPEHKPQRGGPIAKPCGQITKKNDLEPPRWG